MLAVFDASGAQRVALYAPDGTPLLTTGNPGVVQGPAAHDAVASGNPLRAAGVYRATPPGVADGDLVDLLADAAGRPLVDVARVAGVAPTMRTPADGAALVSTPVVEAILKATSDGSTLDFWRGNTGPLTALASQARTATTSGPTLTNYNGRGVAIVLEISAVGAPAGQIDEVHIEEITNSPTTIYAFTGLTITTLGVRKFLVYPGAASAGGWTAAPLQGAIPRNVRVKVVHGNANSITYSVIFQFLV